MPASLQSTSTHTDTTLNPDRHPVSYSKLTRITSTVGLLYSDEYTSQAKALWTNVKSKRWFHVFVFNIKTTVHHHHEYAQTVYRTFSPSHFFWRHFQLRTIFSSHCRYHDTQTCKYEKWQTLISSIYVYFQRQKLKSTVQHVEIANHEW